MAYIKTGIPRGPKPKAGAAREVVIRTRFTESERDRIMLAAKRENIILSEKLRAYLLRWASRVLG